MIMESHYHVCQKSDRPKIFAMTASPVWNSKNPEKSLKTFETNMDCKVMSVKENALELQKHDWTLMWLKEEGLVDKSVEYKWTPETLQQVWKALDEKVFQNDDRQDHLLVKASKLASGESPKASYETKAIDCSTISPFPARVVPQKGSSKRLPDEIGFKSRKESSKRSKRSDDGKKGKDVRVPQPEHR